MDPYRIHRANVIFRPDGGTDCGMEERIDVWSFQFYLEMIE